MKRFLAPRDNASKGAALMIVLALVVLLTGLALAYMSRTTTDRQLAQSSYNHTSADLLARSALDIVVNDFKQEILAHPTVTPGAPCYITPVPYGTPASGQAAIPNLIRRSFSGDPTNRTSSIPSTSPSANQRSISLARWNGHYLIPRATPIAGGTPSESSIDSSPVSSFVAPDWVLVTAQGPTPSPSPSAVIGRYAFAVYDEGGLLDMSLAGYPNWSTQPVTNCPSSPSPYPSPTPWLVNVGRKGIMAFADLSVLPWPSASPSPSKRIDNIVGWRNYAMTQRASGSFGAFDYSTDNNCAKQDWYGSYLLNFGNPPFIIDSLSDKLLASIYPFTSAANYTYPTPGPGVSSRTDQALMTRQELLKVMLSLGSSSTGYNQNVLQYMGTFSRERNWPAPGWPGLGGRLSDGRFNLNNLALVLPNPADCNIPHGRKVGWQTGKNKNHLCGDSIAVHTLFGLFWVRADAVSQDLSQPGYWRYIGNRGLPPDPNATPTPNPGVNCLVGPNQQNDFFQILDYALFQAACETDDQHLDKTFAIGASLIDQYDSGEACGTRNKKADFQPGCDLDARVADQYNQNRTHTTVIVYGHGNGNSFTAYGMEPDYSSDSVNGDDPWQGNCSGTQHGNNPHRPCNAPTPIPGQSPQVISHAFYTVGDFGYGINTSDATQPTLKFWDSTTTPPFQYAPVLDFFSYNPISSAYPRAGIVNLYTRNAPVLAAILAGTLETDAAASAIPSPSPVISQQKALDAAQAIVTETQRVLTGVATPVSTQTDMTRAIAGRLTNVAANKLIADSYWPSTVSSETKNAIARALAEMGQTRTWNLFIDVIAQTGRYSPDATSVSQANKFTVEGEKRYWLHIALGRDLVHSDGTPCGDGIGCQVDVLGSQLEEVTQ